VGYPELGHGIEPYLQSLATSRIMSSTLYLPSPDAEDVWMPGPKAIDPAVGSVFESYKRPSLISSAISIAKAGDAGKPMLVKRVSHRTRVFSSARERIYSNS
jgi:hypothetical protein